MNNKEEYSKSFINNINRIKRIEEENTSNQCHKITVESYKVIECKEIAVYLTPPGIYTNRVIQVCPYCKMKLIEWVKIKFRTNKKFVEQFSNSFIRINYNQGEQNERTRIQGRYGQGEYLDPYDAEIV